MRMGELGIRAEGAFTNYYFYRSLQKNVCRSRMNIAEFMVLGG